MRKIGKLSPAKLRALNTLGTYGDGDGLWFNVGPSGSKSWLRRYMLRGRAREMGLGPYPLVGPGEARARNRAAARLCLDGIDPIDQRRAERDARRQAEASAVSFRDCAAKYIAANRSGWRNAKHAAQWDATLTAYAYPTIGALPVGAIDTGHVTKVLEPIWTTKPETASRVRGRIEAVLDYATTHRWRTGENPARWRGHLENVLPKRSKVAKVEHHAALPWREIGAFMAALAGQEGVAALALRFAILTAGRTGEVIGARWSEIDQRHAVWIVPAKRMKADREHRVPLSPAAMAVLREAGELKAGEADGFLFPGMKGGKPLSNMSLLMVLRRMRRGDLTTHGMRSTFRDWAAETGKPADIAEAALAHVVGDKTVAAYQRGDLLDRRRRLMEQWAEFCGRAAPEGGAVVPLRA
jgi:integrase